MKYRFECPKCKADRFEEILTSVTQTTPFKAVHLEAEDEDSLDFDYEDVTTDEGALDRFQCAECGHVIAHSRTELAEWLLANGKIVPENCAPEN